MEDASAFSIGNPQTSWAGVVSRQRDAHASGRRASDSQELVADKAELKSELNALLNSVGIAMAKLLKKTHGKSVRINEYEMVQSEAERVLSALSEPGSLHQLGELSRQESVIRGQFTLEAERKRKPLLAAAAPDDDGDDDDGDDTPAMPRAAMGGGAAAQTLGRRRGRLQAVILHQGALQQDAATLADDSKTDLMAAVAVAALLHGGYENKDKVEAFLEKTRHDMEKAEQESGAAGAGATVDERLAVIMREGRHIAESMGAEAAEANASVARAAQAIAGLHLGRHQEDCARHLAEARECIAESKDPTLADFDAKVGDWQKQMVLAEGKVKADDLIRFINEKGIGGIFDGVKQHTSQGLEALEAQSGILDKPMKVLQAAQDHLSAMEAGQYHGDAAATAAAAGTTRAKIYEEAASAQQSNAVAPESEEHLNARIMMINHLWKTRIHAPAQGAAMGPSN